jgi:dTDP-glucose pyrophosphorylase
VDGYLEVFRGRGANWSYVRPADGTPGRVAETAEKREISNLCCTGLYHFASADLFARSFGQSGKPGEAGELYVAPLYNFLIGGGADIRFDLIERGAVTFCGVPEEYEAFREQTGDGRI